MSRRKVLGVLGSVPVLVISATGTRVAHSSEQSPATGVPYLFFSTPEARFVAAACDHIVPADEDGVGALGAGVPAYIDGQLAGGWGRGEAAYRSGPWQPGSGPGRLGSASPAQFFRTAVSAIPRDIAAWRPCAGGGSRGSFDRLKPADQVAYLHRLAGGRAELGDASSALLFQMILGMTVEGFLSHPFLGRSRERIAWRLPDFPGALSLRA